MPLSWCPSRRALGPKPSSWLGAMGTTAALLLLALSVWISPGESQVVVFNNASCASCCSSSAARSDFAACTAVCLAGGCAGGTCGPSCGIDAGCGACCLTASSSDPAQAAACTVDCMAGNCGAGVALASGVRSKCGRGNACTTEPPQGDAGCTACCKQQGSGDLASCQQVCWAGGCANNACGSCSTTAAAPFTDLKSQYNRAGGDIRTLFAYNVIGCMAACQAEPRCEEFVLNTARTCYLKTRAGNKGINGPELSVVISGFRDDTCTSCCQNAYPNDNTKAAACSQNCKTVGCARGSNYACGTLCMDAVPQGIRMMDVTAAPAAYMEFVADDAGDGARMDASVYKPRFGYWFGHVVAPAIGGPPPPPAGTITLPRDIEDTLPAIIAPPVGWYRMWGMRKCGVGQRGVAFGLWCPIAPPGYVALGCVFRRTNCGDQRGQADETPPAPEEIDGFMTISASVVMPGTVTLVWNDKGSGAQDDGAMWTVQTSDPNGYAPGVMIAQNNYDAPDPARAFVIDKRKLPLASLDFSTGGSVRDSVDTSDARRENAALLKFSPSLRFHPFEETFPLSMSTLLAESRLLNSTGNVLLSQPISLDAFSDLSANEDTSKYYLEVSESVWRGTKINRLALGPVYAFVSAPSSEAGIDYVELHYYYLYGKQAAQVFNADRVLNPFYCVIGVWGEHQGDLEHVVVRVKPDYSDFVDGPKAVGFEHHGDVLWWPRSKVFVDYGTHPVALAAKNGHGMYNAAAEPGCDKDACSTAVSTEPGEWGYDLGGQSHVLSVLDLVAGKAVGPQPLMQPWLFRNGIVRIGIQVAADGKLSPYNDQRWVLFKGRFGVEQRTDSTTYGTYLNGNNLNSADWTYVKLVSWVIAQFDGWVHTVAELFGGPKSLVKEELKSGNGPTALGRCDFTHAVCSPPTAPVSYDLQQTGWNVVGGDVSSSQQQTESACQATCTKSPVCDLYVYHPANRTCYLKTSGGTDGKTAPSADNFGIKTTYLDVQLYHNRLGGDISTSKEQSAAACRSRCSKASNCDQYVYSLDGTCWLKTMNGTQGADGPDPTVRESGIKGQFTGCRTAWNVRGRDLEKVAGADVNTCKLRCLKRPDCELFVLSVDGTCWLKGLQGTDGSTGSTKSVQLSCVKGSYSPCNGLAGALCML